MQYGRCSFIAAYYTLAFDRLELRGASGDNADTPEGVRGSWIACRFRSRNGPGSDEREGVLSRTHSRLLCCRVAITEHDYCRTWCAGHKFSNNLRKWHRTGFVYLLKWVPGPLIILYVVQVLLTTYGHRTSVVLAVLQVSRLRHWKLECKECSKGDMTVINASNLCESVHSFDWTGAASGYIT